MARISIRIPIVMEYEKDGKTLYITGSQEHPDCIVIGEDREAVVFDYIRRVAEKLALWMPRR